MNDEAFLRLLSYDPAKARGNIRNTWGPSIPPPTRRTVLHRAQGQCERCSQSRPLQLHHLTYDWQNYELPEDLEALCEECHRERHYGLGFFILDMEERDYYDARDTKEQDT